jgi:four helix bundle protein
MALVENIYVLSKGFPTEERFSLTAQIRRAAVSIPSNIAEGQRRKRRRAFLHHLDIALGSQAEVEVQLLIARRLGYCADEPCRHALEIAESVGKMLNGLIASIQPENDEP